MERSLGSRPSPPHSSSTRDVLNRSTTVFDHRQFPGGDQGVYLPANSVIWNAVVLECRVSRPARLTTGKWRARTVVYDVEKRDDGSVRVRGQMNVHLVAYAESANAAVMSRLVTGDIVRVKGHLRMEVYSKGKKRHQTIRTIAVRINEITYLGTSPHFGRYHDSRRAVRRRQEVERTRAMEAEKLTREEQEARAKKLLDEIGTEV